MKQIVQTKRLNIREFRYSDAAFIVKLFNSTDYKKHNGNNNVNNLFDGENYLLTGPIKSYYDNKFGFWIVELKNNKTPIGLCGFVMADNIKKPHFKCAYLPQFFRNGFAFEAATAVLVYANEMLNIKSVFANTVKENIPAIKLLEKLGLVFKQNINMPLGQEDLMQFGN
jgi:ribosomal-protein-alanine N-acetyltransferase